MSEPAQDHSWSRRESGEVGVRSKGSPGRPRLSSAQIARLKRELERGRLVHGRADQRWTLARVKTLIGRLFHVS
ncbi:hypothetical protein [Streptomyces sp. NPDC005731]|uniref:hypothetical protein n=1 Tax=Streptomyces sp. NPDC005731 TaxID=3157056 RepID=UPI003402CB1C